MQASAMQTWNGRKLVIAGGSGFLGGVCTRHFTTRGAHVVVLSRSRPRDADSGPDARVRWVPWTSGDDAWRTALSGADALLNFVGRTVNCRKTPGNCDEILRSRVDSVRHLGRALAGVAQPPRVWVQAGTAHIYGDPPTERVGDDAAPGWGLAPFVGKAWEEAFHQARPAGMRGVVLRTSFVLDRREGPLPVLTRLARCGLGGPAGHGRQGFSWIHAGDFAAAVERLIADDAVAGTVNITAPEPVSQAEFMRTLRRVLGVPLGLPAPALAVRFGARWILNTDPELVLEGRYVLPTRLREIGFAFQHPTLASALTDLLRAPRT